MILEYIKKVVGIALTTPSSTLVSWCTINKTPEYQRKCDKNENSWSHTTLLWLGASFGAPFQLQAKPKVCRFQPKHVAIIPFSTKSTVHKSKAIIFLLALTSLLTIRPLLADSISNTDKYAWSENAGWLDFSSNHEQVSVYNDHIEGYVWSEAIGWIHLGTYGGGDSHTYSNNSNTTYGINNDGNGNLSGYGWSENAGWIDFNPNHSQVTINAGTGGFDGYAWSESIGWVHFQNTAPTAYKVKRILNTSYVPDAGYSGRGSIAFGISGQSLSGISITTADGNKPAGTTTPFGKISYQVTSPNNGTATVRLTFSTTLPATFTVYKVDNAGNYTPIPENAGADGFWVKVDNHTIDVTLLDNGAFDLNAALGVIDDPIVIGLFGAINAIPTISFWGLLFLTGLLSLLARQKIKQTNLNG